jgi:TRAP-type C4-dicarboxylate transport system permease small subunit
MALAARVASASRAMARITGALIILIMIAVVIDAVLRGMMGIAIWGVLEVGVLLLLALIYLGLPATQANRENFRVSIFAERFPPWVDRRTARRAGHSVLDLMAQFNLFVQPR